MTRSLPTRGAWIEIQFVKFYCIIVNGRSPHGERGLKYIIFKSPHLLKLSLPTRGAWIEISQALDKKLAEAGRSPHGERGLK